MIKSFKHKGLGELFEKGKSKRVSMDFAPKLIRQMDAIHQADLPEQLNFPGYGLHELKGDRSGIWAMKVNKNWRLTFGFESGDAIDLDLEDYHYENYAMAIKIERRPTHPGAILREDTLLEVNLSADELADAIGISREVFSEVLNEKSPVTADIAHRLGRAFGMSPDIWLRMQQSVDLHDEEVKNKIVYSQIERIAA